MKGNLENSFKSLKQNHTRAPRYLEISLFLIKQLALTCVKVTIGPGVHVSSSSSSSVSQLVEDFRSINLNWKINLIG